MFIKLDVIHLIYESNAIFIDSSIFELAKEELRNKHFYYHIAIYISFRKSGRSCFLR